MEERYRTLAGPGESELNEKKSRFLGHAAPVQSREEGLDFFLAVRAKHRDASHNVPAYSIRLGNLTHGSDDGEPSGTAGMPVLDVLQKARIVDAAIVVTRYFGGTLLGAGGLARAYSAAAAAAVRNAGVAVMERCLRYSVSVEYPLFDPLQKLLRQCGARIGDTAFADCVTVWCTVKAAVAAPFLESVRELTRGGEEPRFLCETFELFECAGTP